MSEACTHDCSSCGSDCASRDMRAPANPNSHVKKVIAVVSGKGGVGTSTVTSGLAAAMARRGKKVGILDADITGPSIPTAFNIHEKASGDDVGVYPAVSAGGIKVISLNMFVEHETDPVIWRGPVIAGAVKQFWTDVLWEDVDYMFVDMPPGTGDVPLTVFQSLPLDGIVVVTTPQDLVSMIVGKAVKMAEMMDVPVLGIVENMSYVECPDCGKKISIFGESHVKEVADKYDLLVLSQLPINPALTAAVDAGKVEDLEFSYMDDAVKIIENTEQKV